MRRRRSLLNSFTLIELLVVTLVIALLLSILLVSIIQIKDHVRKIICANNLKQIGTFFVIMYNEDKKMVPKMIMTILIFIQIMLNQINYFYVQWIKKLY